MNAINMTQELLGKNIGIGDGLRLTYNPGSRAWSMSNIPRFGG